MPTFEEARSLVLGRVAPLGRERVPIVAAAGRVLSEDIRAPWDMPQWDNSAMDGYAVRSADCEVPATLRLVGHQAAGGTVGPLVTPGCAVKIMTGSPIPEGCDAVVPFEQTVEEAGFVKIRVAVKPREHIRFRGEDVKAGAVPVLLGIAADDKGSLREKIEEGLRADALITSAGVSAGDRDFVREVLGELAVEEVFWKVDIKPGRPLAFGVKDGKPVFALPGNPVSSLVTFEVFVRPALLKMMGHPDPLKPMVKAVLKESIRKKAGRVHFFRVKIDVEDGEYVAWTSGDQNTGILRTMVLANGIAVLPAEKTVFEAGEKVDVYLLYQSATPK
jgi:molybdopterin biosynthesis enzyme